MQILTYNETNKEATLYAGDYVKYDSIIKTFNNSYSVRVTDRIRGYDKDSKLLFSLPLKKTNIFYL